MPISVFLMMNSPAYVENDVEVVKESEAETNNANNKAKTVEEDVTKIKNFRNQMLTSLHVDASDKKLVLPPRLNTIQSGRTQ